MALRHGKDALRVETLQANEQTLGVPAPGAAVRAFQSPEGSRANGTLTATPEGRRLASDMGKLGGRQRAINATKVRVLRGLGLRDVTPDVLVPYLGDADQFCTAEVARLAREDGGGICPQNAAIMVQQACLALAGSRAAYATGDLSTGAKLGVEVRQNLLAARELTVLEAKSRAAVANSADRWRRPVLPTSEVKK